MTMVFSVLALAAPAFGVFALYLAWRRRGGERARRRGLIVAGWTSIAAGLIAGGATRDDAGVATAAVAAVLAAVAVLRLRLLRSGEAPAPVAQGPSHQKTHRTSGRRRTGSVIADLLLAGPAAGAAALLGALALAYALLRLGAAEANAIVAALIAFPLAWAVLAVVLSMARGARRKTLWLGATVTPAAAAVLSLSV